MPAKRVVCPNCEMTFSFKTQMMGRRCKCAKCNQVFRVTEELVVDDEEEVVSVVQVSDEEQVAVVSTPAPVPVVPIAEVAQEIEPVEAVPVPIQPEMKGLNPLPVVEDPGSDEGDQPTAAETNAFEQLAIQTMEQVQPQAAPNVTQVAPTKAANYQTNIVKGQDRNTEGTVFRGFALMLFGVMLFGLAMLGMSFPGQDLVCPVGAMIASIVGCVGALMAVMGLSQKKGAAFLYGILPCGGFLASAALVIFLFVTGYWGEWNFAKRMHAESNPETRTHAANDQPTQKPNKRLSGNDSDSRTNRNNRNPSNGRNQANIRESKSRPTLQTKPWSNDLGDVMRMSFGLHSEKRGTELTWKSSSVGTPISVGRDYVRDKDDKPMLGFLGSTFGSRKYLHKIVPVYARETMNSDCAKPDYAVGGLKVLTKQNRIYAIQCIYMKIDGDQLNVNDQYFGEWIGNDPEDGNVVELTGEGRMISGLWFDDFPNMGIGIYQK